MKNLYIILIGLIVVFSTCQKIPNGGIPTYIKIANPTLDLEANQGAMVHNISDLWIETEGTDLGAYEYPSIFAAYLAGEKDVTVNAGIFYDGNTSERRIYDALDPYITNINFIQEDTILIEPVFKYKDFVEFLYIEDFESTNNFSNIVRTDVLDTENITGRAGSIILSASENSKTSETISEIDIVEGSRVYLEFSMKTENYGGFGIKSALDPTNIITLGSFAPYDDWVHIYINLTNTINTVQEGQYDFYFDVERADLEGESTTYIDNIKILQF